MNVFETIGSNGAWLEFRSNSFGFRFGNNFWMRNWRLKVSDRLRVSRCLSKLGLRSLLASESIWLQLGLKSIAIRIDLDWIWFELIWVRTWPFYVQSDSFLPGLSPTARTEFFWHARLTKHLVIIEISILDDVRSAVLREGGQNLSAQCLVLHFKICS